MENWYKAPFLGRQAARAFDDFCPSHGRGNGVALPSPGAICYTGGEGLTKGRATHLYLWYKKQEMAMIGAAVLFLYVLALDLRQHGR